MNDWLNDEPWARDLAPWNGPKSVSGALAVTPIEAKVVVEADTRRARRVSPSVRRWILTRV